jgi:ankyrin repeat protein
MSEAATAALRAENAALNARCAANPREAANFAARLRRIPHAHKVDFLFNSAIEKQATLVRLLLADGLSPNTTDPEQGDTMPLHAAAQSGAIDVVRLLLEAGADANCCDDAGNTPLVNATTNGQLACARELIPHTDLRTFNTTGNNVLHTCILANQPEIFKLLLPHFADNIDVRTIKSRPPAVTGGPYNATSLMLACQGGYHAMVKALLAAGASRTAHDSNSYSCLHYAACGGHLACVTLLIGRPENQKMSPAEIDARAHQGQTALYLAAKNGHRYCCAALLAAGADPAAAAHSGHTALDAAKHFYPGNQELIELLECRGGGPAPLLCAGCGASDNRLRACLACGSASFCSNACMAQFWPVHKAECKRIQAENEEKSRSRITIHKPTDVTPAP